MQDLQKLPKECGKNIKFFLLSLGDTDTSYYEVRTLLYGLLLPISPNIRRKSTTNRQLLITLLLTLNNQNDVAN